MRNIWTIFQREWGAYFKSPIGYIFLIVFLLLSVWAFIWRFFDYPVADMRPYFGFLPFFYAVFMPAATMRLWAEERRENTYEMLLTFPMRTHELVLGKFLAGAAFLGVALAGTLTIPIMLAALGDPDGWVIAGSYVGAFLLGALFLALGLFFSGLFHDQISAFVVSLLTCLGLVVLGVAQVVEVIDSWSEQMDIGTLLMKILGVAGQFESFTRGVLEIKDVLFFLVWTALFLFLNGLYIDMRERRGGRTFFAVAVTLSLAVGLLFNGLFVDASFGRFDLTEDRVYTLSDPVKRILGRLKHPVQVKLYITRRSRMPTSYKDLEREITDRLNEMRVASGGLLSYKRIHPDAANVLGLRRQDANRAGDADSRRADVDKDRPDEQSLEQRLGEQGVQPFVVRDFAGERATLSHIYCALGLVYREKAEVYVPQIDLGSLVELEYRVVRQILWLDRKKAPVIALYGPTGRPAAPGQRPYDPYSYVEGDLTLRRYDVRRFAFTRDDPIPKKADVLVLFGPAPLNLRQQWEVSRWIAAGRPALIAVQRFFWQLKGFDARHGLVEHGVNTVLRPSGLAISDDLLLDPPERSPRYRLPPGPMHILVPRANFNQQTSIANGIRQIYYYWGSVIKTDPILLPKSGIQVTTLMSTSKGAWEVPGNRPLYTSDDFTPDRHPLQQFPLAVLAEGRFRNAFAESARPRWPDDPTDAPTETRPLLGKRGRARVVVIGCANLFQNTLYRTPDHQSLLVNCLDILALSPDLLNVRTRVSRDRGIQMPEGSGGGFWNAVNFWRFFNLGLVNMIIAGVGVVTAVLRRRSRHAYTVRHLTGPTP